MTFIRDNDRWATQRNVPQTGITEAHRQWLEQGGFSNIRAYATSEYGKCRPAIYERFKKITRIAGLPDAELYVADRKRAYSSFVPGTPHIVLSKELLSLLNDEEAVALSTFILQNT